MKPLPFVHVRSSKFPAMPGEEDELINPGMYGKALATHLQERLLEKGYGSPLYCCEDWGWWVAVKHGDFSSGVCIYCIRQSENEQEYCVCTGSKPGRRWSWRKFRMMDFTPSVMKLDGDLRLIFASDPEVEVVGFPEDMPLIEQD